MSISDCYLFKNAIEFRPISDISVVPPKTRGIYVLFRKGTGAAMNVVYVGMARGEKSGIRGRLMSHQKKKSALWTHFSAFEVWDNIPKKQVEELEGLFRHIYRHDSVANGLNVQKSYKPLSTIVKKSAQIWKKRIPTKRSSGSAPKTGASA